MEDPLDEDNGAAPVLPALPLPAGLRNPICHKCAWTTAVLKVTRICQDYDGDSPKCAHCLKINVVAENCVGRPVAPGPTQEACEQMYAALRIFDVRSVRPTPNPNCF